MDSLPAEQAPFVAQLLEQVQRGEHDAALAWQQLCRRVLTPALPFDLHRSLHARVFARWDAATRGPPPVWVPTPEDVLGANLAAFMDTFRGDVRWAALRRGSPALDWPLLQEVSWANPEAFWGAWLQEVGFRFEVPPTRILQEDPADPDASRWLPGARLNVAAAALAGARAPPGAPALVWADESAPGRVLRAGWGELRCAAAEVAAAVRARFAPGDPLAINMPMGAAAVALYLGCVLAGCPVVSIADSFAPEEVAARLRISRAKGIFTQDVVLRGGRAMPLYARVKEAGAPTAIVIPAAAAADSDAAAAADSDAAAAAADAPSPASDDAAAAAAAAGGGGGGALLRLLRRCAAGRAAALAEPLRPLDLSWGEFMEGARGAGGEGGEAFVPHIGDAGATTNILFSSGTTGEPKAIPWTQVTPLRCGADGWAHQDIHPGQVVCWPTNLGWMMGPWLIYASLLNCATIAVYQGAPQGRDFGAFVAAARVNVLGLVPSLVKAWRGSGCMAGLDWSSLTCFSSTGEASGAEDYHWLASRVAGYRPVIEICGGTEIGGGFLSGTRLQPQAPATFSTPSIGARLVLLGPGGEQSPPAAEGRPFVGELALEPPLLGASQALLHRDHAAAYYAGMPRSQVSGRPLRRHGDEVARLPGGFYVALGRTDDTMNLGGIKVASVELERVVLEHVAGVAEVAAVGVPPPGGGPEQLHLFVVPTPGAGPAAPPSSSGEGGELRAACAAALRAHLNPLFKVEGVAVRGALPRTATHKVMRRLLRDELLAARTAAAAAAAGAATVKPRARL